MKNLRAEINTERSANRKNNGYCIIFVDNIAFCVEKIDNLQNTLITTDRILKNKYGIRLNKKKSYSMQ